MKTCISIVIAAAFAAACGGADDRPASSPTTASTYGTSPTNETSHTTTSSTPASTYDSRPSDPVPATPMPATRSATSSPAPAAPATPPGPAVANDPGAADHTKSADNTKNNDRDRHGALTATDQGNSGDETKITAAIRRGIVADKSLSFGAKNAKVITVGSKVTLRGPVKSEQEKATIEAIAKQATGVTAVDNQLEVKK